MMEYMVTEQSGNGAEDEIALFKHKFDAKDYARKHSGEGYPSIINRVYSLQIPVITGGMEIRLIEIYGGGI